MVKTDKGIRIGVVYYGILQSLHLLTLARAGLLILRGVAFPFPILPPPQGWNQQSMAFLFGLAGTDVIGILVGIIFAGQLLLKGKLNRTLGVLSLTIFITGAVVFGAGTFPSGAWAAHPMAYGVMVVLFAPVLLIYSFLLRNPKAE